MASFNRVILMGNLTRDIEMAYTSGGMAVSKFGLAVNDRRKNQAGEWVDEATYIDITMFGRTAEIASEYLSKGSPVFVEGRLKFDTWEKDGQKRSKLYVIGDRMQLIGGRGDGQSSSSRGGQSNGQNRASAGGKQSFSSQNNSNSEHSHGDDSHGEDSHGDSHDSDSYHEENIPF